MLSIPTLWNITPMWIVCEGTINKKTSYVKGTWNIRTLRWREKLEQAKLEIKSCE